MTYSGCSPRAGRCFGDLVGASSLLPQTAVTPAARHRLARWKHLDGVPSRSRSPAAPRSPSRDLGNPA
ncbi:hypothetical protein VULLAG_LOCUS15107 [Vulpes lagopus]